MRGCTAEPAVPRGATSLTLKASAELIEGDMQEFREELFLTKYWMQKAVDVLWKFPKPPKLNQVHQLFYEPLRKQGFRAHQAKQIYKYALALVKSARANKGSKPVLKRLTAVLDKYDASVDTESWTVTLKMRDRTFKLKVRHRPEYLQKFKGRKWYEVRVGIDKQGKIQIAIPFKWEYQSYEPRSFISLDLNLKTLVIHDGRKIRRYKTRFPDAYSKKVHAERLQKKYPKRWRYDKRILNKIRNLHRKGRNVVVDWTRKFAKQLVLSAKKRGLAIVLEDLDKLWHSKSQQNKTLADKLSRFAYKKVQQAVITKAVEHGVPVHFIDPKNTSRICPKCGAKLKEVLPRVLKCPRCGLLLDRDSAGAMNIWKRGGCGGAWVAPKRSPGEG